MSLLKSDIDQVPVCIWYILKVFYKRSVSMRQRSNDEKETEIPSLSIQKECIIDISINNNKQMKRMNRLFVPFNGSNIFSFSFVDLYVYIAYMLSNFKSMMVNGERRLKKKCAGEY